MLKNTYLVLAVIGTAVPYGFFLPWIVENGFSVFQIAISGFQSPLSAFAWADVFISAIALVIFIIVESKRLNIQNSYWPILGTLTIGVSFGLPIFLYMREKRLCQNTGF